MIICIQEIDRDGAGSLLSAGCTGSNLATGLLAFDWIAIGHTVLVAFPRVVNDLRGCN